MYAHKQECDEQMRLKQEADEERARQQREADEQRRKKLIKQGTIVGAVIIGFIALCVAIGAISNAVKYNAAVKLSEQGNYMDAREKFKGLGDYSDSKEQALKQSYLNAQALAEQQEYVEAVKAFSLLDGYSNSWEQAHAVVIELYNNKQYDKVALAFEFFPSEKNISAELESICEDIAQKLESVEKMYSDASSHIYHRECTAAVEILTALGEYKDSAEKLAAIKNDYATANELAEKNDFYGAAQLWEKLGDYKDSAERLSDLLDFFSIGDIKWQILCFSPASKTVELIAIDCVAQMPYHSKNEEVTWLSSSLYKWLTDDFYNRFTDEQKAQIVGNISLPKEDSVKALRLSDKVALYKGNAVWWWIIGGNTFYSDGQVDFRTRKRPNYTTWSADFEAYYVDEKGYDSSAQGKIVTSIDSSGCGVRPVMWVSLNP